MKAVALALALGGPLLVARLAMAQGSNQPTRTPSDTQSAPPAAERGAAQVVEHISQQAARQLAQQPEIQQALNGIPNEARNALTKAAQDQGGDLIGVATAIHVNAVEYVGEIGRGGILYRIVVDPNGKVTSWTPWLRL